MSTASAVGSPGGSSIRKPANKAKKKRNNPVHRIIQQEVRRREASLAPPSNKKACPKCKSTDISEGACQNCGFVVDDTNIVSEITFGEASNGAAVAHGTTLAADQGGIRPTARGQAFQRLAGSGLQEARAKSLREATTLLQEFTFKLNIDINMADAAAQIYKIAMANNFVQGRRKPNVCAVCMYAACRERENNRVMLIDLADIIKVDVFLLGRSYKELLKQFPNMKDKNLPIPLEDLIFRFASKLEFLHDTEKVALTAIRIAKRMSYDNISQGRRPAGICGAAIIMAARAHNYRRTVREVVYIAKVTMATLQERMEEFANVPAAQLTIKEFQEGELPEASFDPPVTYKQSKEWLEKHPGKKRKARAVAQDVEDATDGATPENGNKRQRTGSQSASPSASSTPAPAPVVDQDGFAVPHAPLETPPATGAGPQHPSDRQITNGIVLDAHEASVMVTGLQTAGLRGDELTVDALANEYREEEEESDEADAVEASSEMAMAIAQGIHIPGMRVKVKAKAAEKNTGKSAQETAEPDTEASDANGKKKSERRVLVIDQEWELDEASLEQEVAAHLENPAVIDASNAVAAIEATARTAQRSATPAADATPSSSQPSNTTNTQSVINPLDDPIIHDHEFENDPEVQFCKLAEADIKMKEMLWANHNKDWMRKRQQKIFDAKMAQNGPPKPKRNRARKPRIGEGQPTPADSAAAAAENMLKARKISSRLDFTKLDLFDVSARAPGFANPSTPANTASPSITGANAGVETPTEPPTQPEAAPEPVVDDADEPDAEETAEDESQDYQEDVDEEPEAFDPFGEDDY
ncbi:hypothetical protein QBC42DRAFT_221870 [Cladorrhinum samala]|uniref:Cyclin-like domain-containing protein n=1 Tax=Cladorrhinum samala TaxID=585594 RepID=A0AAV9HW78_9PEZI|nr:hypothetical protein QBC42DRAFT_221870 [Cladorrhinum samala]